MMGRIPNRLRGFLHGATNKNITKIWTHETIEYGVGAVLAWKGLLSLEGYLLYALAINCVHLVDFTAVDRLWRRFADAM